MPTRYNAVGKVSNIEVYNFRLARLFHSLHFRRPSPWKSRDYAATPHNFSVLRTHTDIYANVNISVAVFNKPQLHNIRCRVQTRTARAIFAAVKPTQALTTLSSLLVCELECSPFPTTQNCYEHFQHPLSS